MSQPSERLGQSVAELRKLRGMSTRQLADRLDQLGHRIAQSSISKIEAGKRSVDVDDLMALAVALRTTPNRLLLGGRAGTEAISLTPKVATTAHRAWAWADARWHLDSQYDTDTPQAERADDFRRHARPTDLRLREEHPAARSAHALWQLVGVLVATMESNGPTRSQMNLLDGDPATRAAQLAEARNAATRDPVMLVARALSRVDDEVNALLSEAVGELYQVDAPEFAGQTVDGVRFDARGTAFVRPGTALLDTMIESNHAVTRINAETLTHWLRVNMDRFFDKGSREVPTD
ncbi:helix-turn-helix domain-containing protein [Micromonospora zamorensis]|uniref:helix-turn-helix domain-containing protein n=1 Tax=Micromonospora zamorensis TaxID=709883 RepID=UPI0037BA35A0